MSDLPVYGVNVKDLGASGDASTDDGAVIQKALDGGGLVVVPAGHYRVGKTLRIGSGTRLRLHPAARIFLADHAGVDQSVFLLTNRNWDGGDQDIEIWGGIWDGNNLNNPRGPDKPGAYTGVLINLMNVRGLAMRDVTLRDAVSYHFRGGRLRDFVIEDVRFEDMTLRPNQDGIHLGGFCEDGVIRRLTGVGRGSTNDDLIALNADDAMYRAQNLGKEPGPIRRLRISELSAVSCHTFVRLLSVDQPIEDITVDGVSGGCDCCLLNLDTGRDSATPLFPRDQKQAQGVGKLARFSMRNCRYWRTSARGRKPLIDIRTNLDGFVLADLRRDEQLDAALAAPTLLISDTAPTDVTLEGVGEGGYHAMRQGGSGGPLAWSRMADATGRPAWRGQGRMVHTDRLVLPAGDFDELRMELGGL